MCGGGGFGFGFGGGGGGDNNDEVTCMFKHFVEEICEDDDSFTITFRDAPTQTNANTFTDLSCADCHWLQAENGGNKCLINICDIATITRL